MGDLTPTRDILRCGAGGAGAGDGRAVGGTLTFQYRQARTRKTEKMATRTLPGADFLWLVPQHVLPKACGAHATSASSTPTAPAPSGRFKFCPCGRCRLRH